MESYCTEKPWVRFINSIRTIREKSNENHGFAVLSESSIDWIECRPAPFPLNREAVLESHGAGKCPTPRPPYLGECALILLTNPVLTGWRGFRVAEPGACPRPTERAESRRSRTAECNMLELVAQPPGPNTWGNDSAGSLKSRVIGGDIHLTGKRWSSYSSVVHS